MPGSMTDLLLLACWQTLEMVMVACALAVLAGLPLGVLLFSTRHASLLHGKTANRLLAIIVNGVRSVPFIILMVAITPFTRWIVGTSIGTTAAIVPLTLAAIPFFARLAENALEEVPEGLIEASLSMGASPLQVIVYVLLPEARASLVRGATLTLVTLVGYSAMAGVIGGGGLGDVAIRYGYQRFEVKIMLITVAILIILVQLLQFLGDWIAKRLSAHKA